MFDNKSKIPSTDVMQLTLILTITTAQGVTTSVTVKTHSDDHIPPTYEMTPGFKRFTVLLFCSFLY